MRIIALSLFFIVLLGCAAAPQQDRLYRDLGGQAGIEKIADAFLDNIANDDRVFHFFKDINIDRFRSKFIEHVCYLGGGPCTYTGDSMETAHAGKHITEAQFNAIVEDLERAMERENISIGAQNRLLKILAPMRPQIINH